MVTLPITKIVARRVSFHSDLMLIHRLTRISADSNRLNFSWIKCVRHDSCFFRSATFYFPSKYRIPPTDTTYYCQVFKGPSRYFTKRHVIAVSETWHSAHLDRTASRVASTRPSLPQSIVILSITSPPINVIRIFVLTMLTFRMEFVMKSWMN